MASIDRGRGPNERWIALVVVCMAQLMSILDSTIVNVALPDIQDDLGFSQSTLTWVLNGYLITFGAFLLLCGRLGDLVGRRRVFLVGVTLFTLASAACGLAESQAVLVVGRFVQGLGGAAAVSVIVAIIASEFPSPAERARAMSIYMFIVAGGGSLGLIAGGVITTLLDWHWVFYVNLPIGIATLVLGRMWLVENPGRGIGRDLDVLGAVLITGALIVLVYAIVTASSHGWGSAHTLGIGAVGLAMGAAFVALESRLANPIMPLRIFRVPGLAAANVVRGLLIIAMFSTFFIGVLYLQQILGYGVLTTGVAFLPQTLVMGAMSLGPVAWLVGRVGPRRPILAGLPCVVAGLVLLATAGAHAGYVPVIVGAFLLIGVGAALCMMPLLVLAMAQVPPADTGMASGIANTALQVSAAIGVAVLGSLSENRAATLQAAGHSLDQSLLGGYHLAFWVAVGAAVAAWLVAAVWVRAPRREPAAAASAAPQAS